MKKGTSNRQRGYTLLEYCAGAAIVATILWGALNAMGGNVQGLLEAVGGWASKRAADVNGAN